MEQLDLAVSFSVKMQQAKTIDELNQILDDCAFNDLVSQYQDWLGWEWQGNLLRLKSEAKQCLLPTLK